MTQQMKQQLETSASALKAAKAAVQSTAESFTYSEKQHAKAIEAERVASTRYFTFVNQLLDQAGE